MSENGQVDLIKSALGFYLEAKGKHEKPLFDQLTRQSLSTVLIRP